MKEVSTERIAKIAASYRKAGEKLTSAIEELRQLKSELAEINGSEISAFVLFGKPDTGLRLSDLSPANLAKYRIYLETGCWHLLVWQTGILSKATDEDKRKIGNDIENRKFGEFTEENIARTLEYLKKQEGNCIRNLAKEVFRHFSPNHYQKKPILKKTVENCCGYGSINFSGDKWELLSKALLLLDHQPLPEQYNDRLEQQMNQTVRNGIMEFECPYFKAKFYEKSCTAHLTFTRMDLIETINKIAMME